MGHSAPRVLDEYLVVAAQTGDREAWNMLAKRWHRKLVAHAWRLTGDTEFAHEAAQAGWVEIVRNLHRLDDSRAFTAWAYRIASRRCARVIGEAVKIRTIGEALADMPIASEPDAERAVEGQQLRGAIAALPPDQRAAIALFYLEEMGVAEIAVALNTPVGTIKTRLMHARLKLRKTVEGNAK
ncbi:MAG: sigma-70 family RNA polymerase sigma factor [Sphingomicrobium sp.]